jgi:hypothetical protein
LSEGEKQIGVRRDGAMQGAIPAQEVRVADVGDDVSGCRVLSELGHDSTLERDADGRGLRS